MVLQDRTFDRDAQTVTRAVALDDHHEIEKLISLGWAHLGGSLWATSESDWDSRGGPAPWTFLPMLEDGRIQGDEMVLTHPDFGDLNELCAIEHDEATRQHAIFPPSAEEAIRANILGAYPGWRTGDSTFLIARSELGGEPLAKISIRRLVPPGVLDVGYATMVGHRGRGYAAAALNLFTKWAFESAGVQRIELGIKPANVASVRTALRAGYTLESVRRARLVNDNGTFEDEHSYVAINADHDRAWGRSL